MLSYVSKVLHRFKGEWNKRVSYWIGMQSQIVYYTSHLNNKTWFKYYLDTVGKSRCYLMTLTKKQTNIKLIQLETDEPENKMSQLGRITSSGLILRILVRLIRFPILD